MEKYFKNLSIIIYLLVALSVISCCGISFLIFNNQKKTETRYDVSALKEVHLNDVVDMVESKKEVVLLVGRDTCSFCASFLPHVVKAQTELEFTTKYVNLLDVNFSEDSLQKFLTYLNVSVDEKGEKKEFKDLFGETPMFILFRDGKMIDGFVGYKSYEDLISFLTKNDVRATA